MNQMLADLYPGVAEWVKLAWGQAVARQYVCSPFGFVRPLPIMDSVDYFNEQKRKNNDTKRFKILSAEIFEALRRAQNTPIQSAAGDLTVFACWQIKLEMERAGLDSQVCSNVHDSIWVDIPSDDEVLPVASIMHDVMDYAQDWLPELLPGYDTSWMVVPIIGENELGINAKDALVVGKEPTQRGTPSTELLFEVGSDLAESPLWQDRVGSQFTVKVNPETKKKKYLLPWEGNSANVRDLLFRARL